MYNLSYLLIYLLTFILTHQRWQRQTWTNIKARSRRCVVSTWILRSNQSYMYKQPFFHRVNYRPISLDVSRSLQRQRHARAVCTWGQVRCVLCVECHASLCPFTCAIIYCYLRANNWINVRQHSDNHCSKCTCQRRVECWQVLCKVSTVGDATR